MADRSQHLEQIMENQTRFDLNAAIENWRQELAGQLNLASDDRRELETHLRDAIVELRQRGLNEEESFWLARRRVGQPQPLAEEFVKADPAKVWRERIFWVVLALFAMDLWGKVNLSLWVLVLPASSPQVIGLDNYLPAWIIFYLPSWLQGFLVGLARLAFSQLFHRIVFYLPIAWFAIFLAQGRINKRLQGWHFLFHSRLRFVTVATVLFLAFSCLQASSEAFRTPHFSNHSAFRLILYSSIIYPAMLTAIIAWLMPAQNRMTPERI
jgi:hypothetical protein